MSMYIIKDGTGSGYKARVDSNNDLHVRSTNVSYASVRTSEGESFALACSKLSVTTSTTGKIWFFHLTEDEHYFALDKFQVWWSGGDTNYNKSVELKQYTGGVSNPTTNTTTAVVANTNLGSSKALDGTLLYWDGVGTGMSGDVGMYQIGSMIFAPGYSCVDWDGIYMFEPGRRYAFGVDTPEDGSLVIQLTGYRVDPSSF